MKNDKHSEMNDSSNEQEITSQSKRKILASIGITSGVIGASTLSHNWVKPVVDSVVLPAHAQTTGAMATPTTAAPAATTTTTAPAATTTTTAPSGTDCYVGQMVGPGESCTYPGTSEEFSVLPDGSGHFLFATAGTGINIDSGNYSFAATKQSSGMWRIDRVGN